MKKTFICDETSDHGIICRRSFSTLWNLKRHKVTQHEVRTDDPSNTLTQGVGTIWARRPDFGLTSSTSTGMNFAGSNPITLGLRSTPDLPPIVSPSPSKGFLTDTSVAYTPPREEAGPPSPALTNTSLGLNGMARMSLASLPTTPSPYRGQSLESHISSRPAHVSFASFTDDMSPLEEPQMEFARTDTSKAGPVEGHAPVVPNASTVMTGSAGTHTIHLAQPMEGHARKRRHDLAEDGGHLADSGDGEGSTSGQEDRLSPPRKVPRSEVIGNFARSFRASLKAPIPQYDVKLSQKEPQQFAVEWLLNVGKQVFEKKYALLLSRWGVKPGFQGTCILCPEDWVSANPMDLFDCLDEGNFPSALRPRAWYSYASHGTTLARALAWFSKWPRRGIELDNFLGYGPFQEIDASHLCHHGHCLVHLVLEGAQVNQSRHECKDLAVSARRMGREPPRLCSKHDPPCLLQHAAVTTNETYHIQFNVLCQARGLVPRERKPRSRRYPFATFESGLPCSFPAVAPETSMLTEPLEQPHSERPQLRCDFCAVPKPFASIYAFWVHLVTKHQGVSDDRRLELVKKSAELWRTYWEKHSVGGKKQNRTYHRLLQIEKGEFSWQDVEAWGLS